MGKRGASCSSQAEIVFQLEYSRVNGFSFPIWSTQVLSFLSQKHIANYICGIQTIGHRVIVSDVQESFIWVRYKRNENQLIIFADDTYPRWVTTATLLDYDTVAGADKFGNICVVSVPCWSRGFLDMFSLKTSMIYLKRMRICP